MRRKSKNRKSKNNLVLAILTLIIGIAIAYYIDIIDPVVRNFISTSLASPYSVSYTLDDIPEYSGNKFVYINNNEPNFTDEEKLITTSFEDYSELDYLNRCGVAFANIGKDIMPTTEREGIGMVKPSGWQTVKYDFVDGKYLYNRCHLIGYQLAGENANSKNLITCTRSMNAKTMLDFENKVANYVKNTNNHVLYRVTPIFYGTNLLATGVQMEAYSVEDNGKGISFNVFIYNVEDGVDIDYSNGNSRISDN